MERIETIRVSAVSAIHKFDVIVFLKMYLNGVVPRTTWIGGRPSKYVSIEIVGFDMV